ncbi:MAG: HAMP domain-containing histidine kinase, partial [Lachnospiraceae bacterium]|nr:HAMP domain-containing histidine kinase [Lachnospiraceae bacterium]
CYTMLLFLYLYKQIIRPFWKLEVYADQIAKGNFDVELEQERTNFFGAFTWAFDHMREELVYAKKNEEKAIAENKTIIAALSHDIKTPIASIRAYAEGLEAGLDADYEVRERYVQVIMKKCDEVTKLTNDLVLHSLSELEHLEIKEQYIDIAKALESIVSDLEDGHIVMEKPIPSIKILVDEKRTAQVVENLLNNARKYAPESDISVWAECSEDGYKIHIRDYGEGILPEDMPFVFDKFYRGKNAVEKTGSGLGLYIVKYIMNRMNGDVLLFNREKGLEAVVVFPLS